MPVLVKAIAVSESWGQKTTFLFGYQVFWLFLERILPTTPQTFNIAHEKEKDGWKTTLLLGR